MISLRNYIFIHLSYKILIFSTDIFRAIFLKLIYNIIDKFYNVDRYILTLEIK